jgi:hypothetical protein
MPIAADATQAPWLTQPALLLLLPLLLLLLLVHADPPSPLLWLPNAAPNFCYRLQLPLLLMAECLAARLHPFKLVIHFSVHLAQLIQHFLLGLPDAAPGCLHAAGQHVTEGLGVGLPQLGCHLWV